MNGTPIWGQRQSTAISTVLLVLKIAIAAFLLLAGSARLLGVDEMVQLYRAIGLGQWFRYLSGVIEVAAAILIVIPRRTGLGIVLTAVVVVTSVVEHTLVTGRNPGLPAMLFAAVLVLLYVTRHRMAANGRASS